MPAAILARFVLLEARRGGLPWLAVASVALALGLAAFLSQVALSESLALQASIVAALLRACAVFLIAVHVASSTLRELNCSKARHRPSTSRRRSRPKVPRPSRTAVFPRSRSASRPRRPLSRPRHRPRRRRRRNQLPMRWRKRR